MIKNVLTIGLNDKDTELQIIQTSDAKKMIADLLINEYDVYAFTMIDCEGVYKMASSGNIIRETSIRVEIVTDEMPANIDMMINALKVTLNQESIMQEIHESNIYFK